MLHNVAFVWPALLNMLQRDPTMLHDMLHPFDLGFGLTETHGAEVRANIACNHKYCNLLEADWCMHDLAQSHP